MAKIITAEEARAVLYQTQVYKELRLQDFSNEILAAAAGGSRWAHVSFNTYDSERFIADVCDELKIMGFCIESRSGYSITITW